MGDVYPVQPGEAWGPTDFDVTLHHPVDTQALYSTGLSSFQLLPNGNFLICSGRWGYTFEMTPDNEIVWEYKTPLVGGVPATQGDTLSINNNLTFRFNRYPTDYSAFDGRDLTQKGWIEQEPDSLLCDQILPADEIPVDYYLKIYPNPAGDFVTLQWEGGVYVNFEVFDITGRRIVEPMRLTGGRKYLDTSDWNNGMYFITIEGRYTRKLVINR